MTKNILLVGALDTKGAEYAFVKQLIEQAGIHTLTIDFGVMGEPQPTPAWLRSPMATTKMMPCV